MIIQIADVPAVALDRIIAEFKKYGWEFIRVNRFKGAGKCVAGMATWEWEDDVLTVTITRDEGHFSEKLIRGGLKQVVGEVVEGLGLEHS